MVIYTGGTFDLFHAGHINFLRQCKALAGEGGRVVVALNPDSFVEKFKGKNPVYSFSERKSLLQGCRYVDEVVENVGGTDSKKCIVQVNPDVIAIGSDWAVKNYYSQMGFTQEWLDLRGIILIYLPYTPGVSTTELKRRINET